MRFKNIILILLCVATAKLNAQFDHHRFRLLDADNALPIIDVSFQYGSQQGASDHNGLVNFQYEKGTSMRLSHINYGSWTLDDEQLLEAIQTQVVYRESLIIDLYPVTVIAVRGQKHPEERLHIDFEDRMLHDGATLLHQLPAFNSIRKSGNYGFDIVFRGFKYDQLNVVLNGAQSATAACPNRMDPPSSQMAPNMLDRIEVLKGPHALRYGTGFGATINFIPVKLRFTTEPDVYGRLSSAYESNGQIARGETQIGISSRNYDFSLFGSWSQGNDYLAGNGETVQAAFTRSSFGANLGLKLNDNHQVRVSGLYNNAKDADFPALPMDLREDDTWMLSIRHDINIRRDKLKSWSTTAYTSFVDHLMNNMLKHQEPRMLNAETKAQTHNYGARTEGIWQTGNTKLYGGIDFKNEGATGLRTREFLMGPNAGNTLVDKVWQKGSINKLGLFGEYHLSSNRFHYVLSGRLDYNHSDIGDPGSEFSSVYDETGVSHINPGLSVGIQKLFGQAIKATLWLGRAQRSGSLTERFINYFPVGLDPYEMLGNPQLKPEVNYQTDLGFEWTKNKAAINVDFFAAYLEDYISSVIDTTLSSRLPSSPGVRRFVNIHEAFKSGFELRWVQQLPMGMQQSLAIAYTYAQDLDRKEPLPEIAPLDLRYVLAGSYLKDKLHVEVVFRYVMKQSRISKEYGESITPSFTIMDVKAGYRFFDRLSAHIGVNNLFDQNYYEHLSRSVSATVEPIYAPGRNIFVNLGFHF